MLTDHEHCRILPRRLDAWVHLYVTLLTTLQADLMREDDEDSLGSLQTGKPDWHGENKRWNLTQAQALYSHNAPAALRFLAAALRAAAASLRAAAALRRRDVFSSLTSFQMCSLWHVKQRHCLRQRHPARWILEKAVSTPCTAQ